MTRVQATILALCGIALLATRLISPADSSPRVPGAAPAPEPREEQDVMVETVRAEVDRLRERTRRDPASQTLVRDPFSFGRRPEPRQTRAAEPPADVAPQLPPLVIPPLVAVLVDAGSDGAVRTAVFAFGDTVDLVSTGDSIGEFRVETISPDGVALVHRETGTRYSLLLH